MGFLLFNGEPGETWTNDRQRYAYQLVCDLNNTCGLCLQYHMAISSSWPIPFHFGCRCKQRPIPPGGESEPFVDFREVLAEMPDHQRSEAVGASNYKLIEAGVVKWDDVVTSNRVRDFHEVVSLKKLDVKTLRGAGVSKGVAERAYQSVNTAAHAQVSDARQRLIEAMKAKGVNLRQAREAVAQRLAGKVSIGKGPSGPQSPPPPPVKNPTPTPTPPVKPKPQPKVLKPAEIEKKAKVKLKTPPERGVATRADVDRLRESLARARAADPSGRQKIVADWIRERQSAGTTAVQEHGMATPESLHSLRVGGQTYHFPAAPPKEVFDRLAAARKEVRQLLAGIGSRDMTPAERGELKAKQDAIRSLETSASHPFAWTLEKIVSGPAIPDALLKHTKDVYFVSQANSKDEYWRELFNNPGHVSGATGGGGKVVVYNRAGIARGLFSHEAGHNLAHSLNVRRGTGVGISPGPDYTAAMDGEPAPSDYGKNSPAEDFAEGVRLFVEDPAAFGKSHPRRAAVIERLLSDEDYGG